MREILVTIVFALFLARTAEAEIVKISTDEELLHCAAASEVLSLRPWSKFNGGGFSHNQKQAELYIKASLIAGGYARGLSDEEFEIAIFRTRNRLRLYLEDYANRPDELVDATRRMCIDQYLELATELVDTLGSNL